MTSADDGPHWVTSADDGPPWMTSAATTIAAVRRRVFWGEAESVGTLPPLARSRVIRVVSPSLRVGGLADQRRCEPGCHGVEGAASPFEDDAMTALVTDPTCVCH
jgi:hypothetical protein